MNNILITVDYNSTGVKLNNKWVSPEDLNLDIGVVNEIKKWVSDYHKIIPMSMEQRLSILDKIEELDKIGIQIAKKIKNQLPNVNISYYSEGKLIYIPIE